MSLSLRSVLLSAGVVLLLAGCAGTKPVPYAQLESAPQLQHNLQDDADKVPYSFTAPVKWSDYDAILIEPVIIYQGADNQFEDLTPEEKTELAKYMQDRFAKILGTHFRIARERAPRTLDLRLTLAGAKTNTALVSTVTRFDLLGGPANVVQSIRGKEGFFIGSVSYAVEIRDGADGRLVKAYVTKQFPNALNVGATFGSLAAAETGIDKGAQDLLKQLK